ncbi:MAG: hypothetical protein JJ863_34270 [Deltaproteobacteria bacterium]|nr:hypothetical protein [Deltaproteobacteria bacterium]
MTTSGSSTKTSSDPKGGSPKGDSPLQVVQRRRKWPLVVAAILTLAVFVGGWLFDARLITGPKLEEATTQLEAANARADELEGTAAERLRELETLRERTDLLAARADIARALDALDDRNFGIAQRALGRAAQTLEQSPANGSADLANQVGEVDVRPVEDLSAIREQVKGLGQALDDLLGS